jgi:geranylgeranyl reductase
MCAEEIVAASQGGERIPTEKDLRQYLRKWDRKYGPTYKVLELLQNIFYSNDPAREAFVEMCDDRDVQRLTFDSYLYKRVVAMNPWQQLKLTFRTLGSVLRGQALAPASYRPVPSLVRSEEEAAAILAEPPSPKVSAPPAASAADAGRRQPVEEEREPVLAGR